MKKNLFSCSFLGNIIFMLSAVLCGCNETGTFSEKKYTPVYVYLSTTPYVGESSMSDFVDYPSDLVRHTYTGVYFFSENVPVSLQPHRTADNINIMFPRNEHEKRFFFIFIIY